MAVRALIIAIENYPSVAGGGIAKSLPGTLKAGIDFRTWLEKKWAAEGLHAADTQILFCSEPAQNGGSMATSSDLKKALLKLKADGQNSTEELYVFFSGHGFAFVQDQARADVVISSDFETPELSSQCCFNLDEMVLWLRDQLGPGRHYYFIDACRNNLTAKQVTVGALPPKNPQSTGEPSTFVLQSTVPGATAAVGGPFPAVLLAGLSGKGKAKTWDVNRANDAMFVRYDSLRNYLREKVRADQRITSRTEGIDGESDAVLATLRPIPMSNCKIEFSNLQAPVKGTVLLKRARSNASESKPLDALPFVLSLEPDDYTISVQLDGFAVSPRDPVPVSLYEDRTLSFAKLDQADVAPSAGLEAMSSAGGEAVELFVPSNLALKLRNLASGEETLFKQTSRARLDHGRYAATLENSSAQVIVHKEIEVEPGRTASVNLADWQSSIPHEAIARKLPQYDGGVDFSESLGGAVTDPDLNLWLALLGGGRILGSRGDYSKISQFPLHDFSNERAGASPLYFLAGFENPDTRLRVGLSPSHDAKAVDWVDAVEPQDMRGIREAYFAPAGGCQLLSFQIGAQAPYTIASLASPNRGMLVTLTLGDEGRLLVSQYLLPIGHLLPELPAPVRVQVECRNHLQDIRFVAQASRAFRNRRSLRSAMPENELNELLYAKWLDPIASSLAAYELIRRGRTADIAEVVRNMKAFFPDVPDTSALAKLHGETTDRPHCVPLFFDGLRAFPDYMEGDALPLPASHVDFAGTWTAWRDAVNV